MIPNEPTPYSPSVQFTCDQIHLLNGTVGHYLLPDRIERQTQIRSLTLEWADELSIGSESFELTMCNEQAWLSLPGASAWPQIEEILQEIPWESLEENLKSVTLEVAFQDLLKQLSDLGGGVSKLHPTARSPESDLAIRLTVHWVTGQTSELIFAAHSQTLTWLSRQLASLPRCATQNLGWLPVQADIVTGTTQLPIEDLKQLSAGDQVLFDAVKGPPTTPKVPKTSEAPLENTSVSSSSCRLVFRELPIVTMGWWQDGVVYRNGPATIVRSSSSNRGSYPVRHEPADSNDAVVNLETVLLEVVGGTVECRIDQAVNAQSFPSHSFDDGRFQLQHVSKVVASGHVKTILNRPALRVETLA